MTPSPRLLRVDPAAPDPARLERAAQILRSGGLVAFPTETVYGLGADARRREAVRAIFAAKGRPADNPLIVHVASLEAAQELVTEWPETAELLARHFWPGPLTLLLPKRPEIPDEVSAGLPLVGVRWPAHPVAQALIAAAGLPVAAPSANAYMAVSPTTAAHVAASLGDRVDLILDGGPSPVGIESTVLDVSGPVPTVLRPGGISVEQLLTLLPQVNVGYSLVEAGPRLAPGMARRHYAPRARLELIAERAGLEHRAREHGPRGLAVLSLGDAAGLEAEWRRAMPTDPLDYGRVLYAALHEADAAGAATVLVERPPSTPEWLAINDRLSRAAHR